MSKSLKTWLLAAISLIVIGGMFFSLLMTLFYGWNFFDLSSERMAVNYHSFKEEIREISIESNTADIIFSPLVGTGAEIFCCEWEKQLHSVTVEDGVLIIKATDTRKWYEHIGIYFGTPKIEIYLPAGLYQALNIEESTGDIDIHSDFEFKSVDIKTSTGDVSLGCSSEGLLKVNTSTGNIMATGLTAEELDLSVSTGTVVAENVICSNFSLKVSTGRSALTNVTCRNFTSEGDTGDLRAKNLIAEESVSIKRSTGDVTFDRCDGGEITVLTDTGDIKGSLLSAKVFIAETDTGRVKVPETAVGGRCNLTTDTGDIEINIVE